MSFVSYVGKILVDFILAMIGLGGLMASVTSFISGDATMGIVYIIIAVLSLLYIRYRAVEKGVTY